MGKKIMWLYFIMAPSTVTVENDTVIGKCVLMFSEVTGELLRAPIRGYYPYEKLIKMVHVEDFEDFVGNS